MFLGATSSTPAVELVVGPSGERLPVPVGGKAAFDRAVGRLGWVVVRVGYEAFALCDGDLLSTVRLADDVWAVAPGSNPHRALLMRHQVDTDWVVYELFDGTGRSWKSVGRESAEDFSSLLPVGELASDLIVTRGGLVSWAGEQTKLPASGRAVAVLGGRHVVLADEDLVRVVDTQSSTETLWPMPDASQIGIFSPVYDACAKSVAFSETSGLGSPGCVMVVVGQTAPPRMLDVSLEAGLQPVWLDSHRLLLPDGPRYKMHDVVSGESVELSGIPRNAAPRVDVTGRFDPEQLRAVLRPAWKGVIPKSAREEILEQSRARMAAVAAQAGIAPSVVAGGDPVIRIRSCLGPKRIPIGASRLGGRPDLPSGYVWPVFKDAPMAFLAQLRCEELNGVLSGGVPPEGLLVVFASIEADGGYPLRSDAVHVEIAATHDLKRLSWPADLAEEIRYQPALAVAEPMITVPDLTDPRYEVSLDAAKQFAQGLRSPTPLHQMFGRLPGIDPPAGYELLLQIDSDPLIAAMFGDGGQLHIWYPADVMLDGVLEGCSVELQSG